MPTIVCDPRDLVFDGQALSAHGHRIDFVYRRVLINDILAHPAECDALLRAYEARAICMANTLRCKIPQNKAYYAILTDDQNNHLFSDAERDSIRRHIPWTRRVEDVKTTRNGKTVELLEFVRKNRENFVVKPNDEYGGAGVMLGWETSPQEWDSAIQTALAEREKAWVVQERIAVRREVFPYIEPQGGVAMRDMLVD